MKKKLNILIISIAAILVCASTKADDLNFGKETPSAHEIIEHLKGADTSGSDAATSSASEAGDDGYHDVVKGHSRNLVFMNPTGQTSANHQAKNKPASHKNSISTAVNEAAVSLVVLFDYNSSMLTGDAKNKLAPLAQALISPEMKGLRFKIEGHTDAVGGDEFNKDLSLRRAAAIKDYLIEHYGVDSSSIEVEGKGKMGLADPGNPDSELNRRVRIVRLGG